MSLNDIAVRSAKPDGKSYRLNDSDGLHLTVDPDGKKWWRVDYSFERKRRTISVGRYPAVGLSAARAARDKLREQIASGIDPVRARKGGSADDPTSFEAIARRWIQNQRQNLDPEYADRIETRFEDYVFPFIGRKDIRLIRPLDMLDVVRRLEERGVHQTGRRINQHCSRIFKMAIGEGLLLSNPCGDIVDAFKPQPRVKHRKAMQAAEMGRFLVQLDASDALQVDTKDAMLLTVLTALRTDEVRFADAAEFEGLNAAEPLWRLPPERMKLPREHLVPLSKQAAALVRRRVKMLAPGRTKLFGIPRTREGVVSENRMLYGLYRLGYRGVATMHGFRSTFSTLANEATGVDERRTWNAEWIERQLAHLPGDEVRAVYNAAEYLPSRRRLLQWWADWLDGEREMAALIG